LKTKEITIYQIKSNCDKECQYRHGKGCVNKFQDFEEVKGKLKLSCYSKVYEKEIPFCKLDNNRQILEKIFEKFNINHPDNFTGHSLSVSDIVKIKTKFYYCTSTGWKRLAIHKGRKEIIIKKW
jgi:hypothetical protein